MFMEIIDFIFRGFWTFVGSLMLISAILNGIASIIKSLAMIIHGVPSSEMKKKIVTAEEGNESFREAL